MSDSSIISGRIVKEDERIGNEREKEKKIILIKEKEKLTVCDVPLLPYNQALQPSAYDFTYVLHILASADVENGAALCVMQYISTL